MSPLARDVYAEKHRIEVTGLVAKRDAATRDRTSFVRNINDRKCISVTLSNNNSENLTAEDY